MIPPKRMVLFQRTVLFQSPRGQKLTKRLVTYQKAGFCRTFIVSVSPLENSLEYELFLFLSLAVSLDKCPCFMLQLQYIPFNDNILVKRLVKIVVLKWQILIN